MAYAVRSIANGIILNEDYDSSARNYIVIKHAAEFGSTSWHLNRFLLRSDDLIFAGDWIVISIATGATTEPRLHLATQQEAI